MTSTVFIVGICKRSDGYQPFYLPVALATEFLDGDVLIENRRYNPEEADALYDELSKVTKRLNNETDYTVDDALKYLSGI